MAETVDFRFRPKMNSKARTNEERERFWNNLIEIGWEKNYTLCNGTGKITFVTMIVTGLEDWVPF